MRFTSFIFFTCILMASIAVWAKESTTYTVRGLETQVYASPSDSSPLRQVKPGMKFQGTGRKEGAFVEIKSKSGKSYWVKAEDLSSPDDMERDLAADEGSQNDGGQSDVNNDFARWTFDLGASTGRYAHSSYTEVNFGLNYFFHPWLAWRNALFARFASDVDTVYGLDTSLRVILAAGARTLGLTVFAGPGYRFINEGDNVPFAEGGAVFHLAGISLGGGVKTFFNKMVNSHATENDTQFFIILSGAGSL